MEAARRSVMLVCTVVCIVLLCLPAPAFACTEVYVGSGLTEDGSVLFGRIEDYDSADYAKLFSACPAGTHRAGEVYRGCGT